MKDIIELLQHEQQRLIEQAQPFLDQAERLASAIVALKYSDEPVARKAANVKPKLKVK